MERLVVKNFGPITYADIDVRPYTLLVGHVSSGKSTVAKLLSIFNSEEIYKITSDNIGPFVRLLEGYNIDFPMRSDTLIQYTNEHNEWTIDDNGFSSSFAYGEVFSKLSKSILNVRENIHELSRSYPNLYDVLGDEIRAEIEPFESTNAEGQSELWTKSMRNVRAYFHIEPYTTYIPAERTIFSILEGSIFNMLSKNITIPKSLLEFGSSYEFSKQQLERQSKKEGEIIKIPFVQDISIGWGTDAEDNHSKGLYLAVPNGERLPMRQASSGFQSIIPLFLVVEFYGKWLANVLLIEEPESNLFPTVQNELVKYIVGVTNQSRRNSHRCIITSHSPYILSSFDTLVQAGNASEKDYEKTKEVIPPELWIKYEDISCYYFDEKGNVSYAKNDELKNIGSEVIDSVSDTINEEYDKLLNIIYA